MATVEAADAAPQQTDEAPTPRPDATEPGSPRGPREGGDSGSRRRLVVQLLLLLLVSVLLLLTQLAEPSRSSSGSSAPAAPPAGAHADAPSRFVKRISSTATERAARRPPQSSEDRERALATFTWDHFQWRCPPSLPRPAPKDTRLPVVDFVVFGNESVRAYGIQYMFSLKKALPRGSALIRRVPLASVIPGRPSTYVSISEAGYYEVYRDAYFGLTYKKGGWDCQRHYEIVSNGALPLFPGIAHLPPGAMALWPRDLLASLHAFPGANAAALNWTREQVWAGEKSVGDAGALVDGQVLAAGGPVRQCFEDVQEAFSEYAYAHMTDNAMFIKLLHRMGLATLGPRPGQVTITPNISVLFIATLAGNTDYLGDLLMVGCRQTLGARCIDATKHHYHYVNFEQYDPPGFLYGNGYSYAGILEDDIPIDRENLPARIAAREFSLVIYGTLFRAANTWAFLRDTSGKVTQNYLWEEVMAAYRPQEIAGIVTEDLMAGWQTALLPSMARKLTLFMREFSGEGMPLPF